MDFIFLLHKVFIYRPCQYGKAFSPILSIVYFGFAKSIKIIDIKHKEIPFAFLWSGSNT